jgi:hypothetical protein
MTAAATNFGILNQDDYTESGEGKKSFGPREGCVEVAKKNGRGNDAPLPAIS